MSSYGEIMNLDEKLVQLSELYNLEFYFSVVKDKTYLELNTSDMLDKGCLTHINHMLSSEDYVFDTVEAFDDTLVINYFKK